MTSPSRANVLGFMSAHVAGETHEAFLLFLFAGDTDLLGVDDHDEVTSIDMRRKNRLLFAAQKSRRLDRHVAQHLILGIDQPPLAVDFVGFGGKRLHRRLKKGTETTGRGGHCQPAESGAALICLARPPNKSRVSLDIMAMIGAVPATGSAGTEPGAQLGVKIFPMARKQRAELC